MINTDTVALNEENNTLSLIDQTLLPGTVAVIELDDLEDIREAIYKLKVRGAPAIGVAAAIGLYVVCRKYVQGRRDASDHVSMEKFLEYFGKSKERLISARPTAVNLSWALNRMESNCLRDMGDSAGEADDIRVDAILKKMRNEALAIRDEDIETCRRIGENGLTLIKKGSGILTHCNAGQLATVRYGTATAPMYLAHERGYGLRIYCDETRPLLQGARLTAFELSEAGMDVTLQCDNMAASLMKSGVIDAVFVGADRIAKNGDAANKIGTLGVATIAKAYGIPFYVCAPTSTIDPGTPDGDHIVIEQRPGEEVSDMWYERPMAPEGVNIYNPAFDVTDHELITAIITEKGIFREPFSF